MRKEASFVWRLESLLARANLLQKYNHYMRKPDFITQDLNRFRNAEPEKIRDYAAKYLRTKNRIEVLTEPTAVKGK